MSMLEQLRLDALIWSIGTIIFILVGSYLIGKLSEQIALRLKLTPIESKKIFWGFFFASPWIIGFVIFVLGPSLVSLYYSFTKYELGGSPEWYGLGNFSDLLGGAGASGRRFKQAMFNSMYYAIIGVPLQIMAALGMAMLLNTAVKGIRVFRLIFYMPVILAGGPAILLAWRYMLNPNGGFINETLTNLGDAFFLFDWLKRGMIFVVEGFNGFYAGLTRGDPIGPLKYSIPAFIGMFVLYMLIRGQWDKGKRQLAQRVGEVLFIIVGIILIGRGLQQNPIDLSYIFAWSLLVVGAWAVNNHLGQKGRARAWQYAGLLVLAVSFITVLIQSADGAFTIDGNNHTTDYILTIGFSILPIALTFLKDSDTRKVYLLGATIAIVLGIIFIRLIPDQLDGGRVGVVFDYVTMQTSLEDPDSLEYLEDVFPSAGMSSLWIYGAVALTLVGFAIYNERTASTHRYLLYGAFLFFTLLTVGSFIDGLRYFGAFETIAREQDTNIFHFALFRNVTEQFPDSNRIPLWTNNELWSKPSIILIQMWSSGAGMLIFLAALKGVPKSLYEAAEVDGANRIQKFFKITLPMISPAMFYNVVIGIIAALQTFEMIYIMQTPQNQDSLASAAYFLYQRTFQQLEIGQGSAMSWILAVIIVVLTIIQFRYSDWVHYEA